MSQRNFKAGDRVRATKNYVNIVKGNIYVVQEFPDVHPYPVINPKSNGHGIIPMPEFCEYIGPETPLFNSEGIDNETI